MAELLFKSGSFRILAKDLRLLSSFKANELIKLAGTTCYQARETSKKTPEEFIKMLYQRGHLSVLEHSWFCFGINFSSFNQLAYIGYILREINPLFSMTKRKENGQWILIFSGNARMIYEWVLKAVDVVLFKKINNQNSKIFSDEAIILSSINKLIGKFLELEKENPVLFPFSSVENIAKWKIQYQAEKNCDFLERNPELKTKEEILNHTAVCVEFNNCSRGFTHEHVRHRLGSYSQESTRYVDYSKGELNLDRFKMKFIFPYNDKFDWNKKINVFGRNEKGKKVFTYKFSPADFVHLIEAFYRALRKEGLKPEEARQWLPIGIKSQIVTTYTLNEWKHWFYMRASEYAHPEIRFIARNLLKKFQKEWPKIFTNL